VVIEKYGKIFEATKESPEPAWRPSLPAGASREEAQEVIFQVSVSAGMPATLGTLGTLRL